MSADDKCDPGCTRRYPRDPEHTPRWDRDWVALSNGWVTSGQCGNCGSPLDREAPMTSDIPADHGSDRYDYVEIIDAPAGVEPVGAWFDQLLEAACQDCRANIFLLWQGTSPASRADPNAWHVTVAHDADCPWLAAAERDALN